MVSIEEAFSLLAKAEKEHGEALAAGNDSQARAHAKLAFYSLFEAVKMANIIFNSRVKKGYLAKGGANSWAQDEFDTMTRALAKEYYARGAFENRGEKEYGIWLPRCRSYIDRLVRQMRAEWSI